MVFDRAVRQVSKQVGAPVVPTPAVARFAPPSRSPYFPSTHRKLDARGTATCDYPDVRPQR